MAPGRKQASELGREAAARLLGHLEGERLIPRFIDSYVMGFDRPQLKNPPEQFRQRSHQLGREALLLLGQLVVEKCGSQFHRLRLGPMKFRDRKAATQFAQSFWSALAAQVQLGVESAPELARQADLYQESPRRAPLFSARVAPLLDPLPQMKEKAEHAGRKFYDALDNVAGQVLTRTFPSG